MADADDVQKEIDSIRQEAASFGYALTGEGLEELLVEIKKIREERAGKPPCYRREYRDNAPHCQVCDLRHDCTSGEAPAYVPVDELRLESCYECGSLLTVELVDEVTGAVRDYGCSNPGCSGTILQQSAMRDKE